MYKNRMQQEFEKKDEQIPVRLNKYLSESGVCSRREADRLLAAGKVQVDGQTAVTGQKVLPTQHITVEGKEIAQEKEMILLAVNKPRGIVCSERAQGGDTTIGEFLQYPRRIFSIGRLDKDSEGLLLMTNNGEILNKIMRAGNFHEKEYLVTVNRPLNADFLEKMGAGVYLKELDVRTRPCVVEQTGKQEFRIVLTQGYNRQIRRMCGELGFRVTRLVRVRIMNIQLGRLKTGAWRRVSDREIEELYDRIKESRS